MIHSAELIPFVYHDERIQNAIRDAYHQWRAGYDELHPAPPVENVRFSHDPFWHCRLVSIQNAHDGNTAFWRTAKVVVTVALIF